MRWLSLVGLAVVTVSCGPPLSVDRTVVIGTDGAVAPVRPRGTAPERPGAVDGLACTVGSDCRSGFCADGLCCNSPCDGTCQACDLPDSAGKCSTIAEGQDPGNDCSEEPSNTCGRDGACDGIGSCRRHKLGTECGPGSCQGSTERAASTCDGKGACQMGAEKSCAPAVCIADSCGAPCATDPDCQAGFFCDEGTCRTKLAQAAECDRAAQCSTGHCIDKVCCGTACTEKCYACNVAGSVGTCKVVDDGEDPRRECPVQNTQTCGNAGGCDGKGGCRLHVAGAPCGFPSCTGSTSFGPSTCDGMGACKQGPAKDCAPYVCNGLGCWTACATNDQCKSPRTCKINACQ